ncbi:hypothetical protein [Streptomyces sp. HPF1205]|uniref:hypothetical protein n=1 Tax=Streptomyces sp. HPF1205 TaxID=2873262 RepID=UPI001CED1E31|nr:hypothetical protein [Streptomyces sp. HPF1205]
MPNSTDHTCPDAEDDVVRILLAVADHFAEVRPTEALDTESLVVVISAETYDACGRSIDGRSTSLALAAHAAAPEMTEEMTRGEYALRLRRQFTASGHDWTDDDNQPVIPIIPGPRQAPQQQDPPQQGAPSCCGRPMRREGQQFVCGECGAWVDNGGEGG